MGRLKPYQKAIHDDEMSYAGRTNIESALRIKSKVAQRGLLPNLVFKLLGILQQVLFAFNVT